ncbi:hypothetical protein D3C81_566710 [compost metagenome]
MNAPIPDPSHWTSLWQSGVLHSCNTAIADNYDGDIQAFWRSQFSTLSPEQRVVDLGTGNGALPLLAKAINPSLRLHGIDSALINPAEDMRNGGHDYTGIQFHPGCAMDTLPFPDGSIQLITSQFAFEYAPQASALAELLRVLDPVHGRIAMVLHSTDSEISQMTLRQLQGLHFLFNTLGIFDKAHLLARAVQDQQQGRSGNAERARTEFNTAANKLMLEMSTTVAAPILDKAHALLHGALVHLAPAPASSADLLERAQLLLQHEQQRLQDMQLAAYDSQRLQALTDMLCKAGLMVATDVLHQTDTMMGWTLVAHRE